MTLLGPASAQLPITATPCHFSNGRSRAVCREIEAIVRKFRGGPVPEADVERLKRQLYGGFIASFDSLEYTANSYIAHYFNGTPYLRYLSILQSITAQEVQEAAVNYLDLENSAVSVLLPTEGEGHGQG